MASNRKRGKLSIAEMQYIEQHCFDDSLEEMARHLNRTIAPIKKYIDQKNLHARDLTDDEHLLSTLRGRYYYGELKKQFSDNEIVFLEHKWIDLYKQFNEDVIPTEEMQIVELCRTAILVNRSMEDRQEIMKNIMQLEEMIQTELDKPADMQDTQALAMFQTQLGAMIGSKSSYINEHEKLLTKQERLLKDIKGTREQRKRIAEDANTNFLIWMRQLDDLDMKDKQGYDMEINRVAANKARERLAEYHEYEDGLVDQPLLNSETVKDVQPDVRNTQQDTTGREEEEVGDS